MTRLKKIYKWTLFLMGVPTCIGCEDRLADPYSPICPDCLGKYNARKNVACSRCGKLLHRCSCNNEYLEAHFIKQHFKVFQYDKHEQSCVGNDLIYSLKRDNRADVVEFLSDELADAISAFVEANENVVFTNVPRRRAAIIEYGMDHARDLAKKLAGHFNCEYMSLLKSKSKAEQKKTHGKMRIDNVVFDFRKKNPPSLEGKTVIIVDDIVTTGVSMATAGTLLRSLGAERIVAASIAVSLKDIEDSHPNPATEKENK